MWSFLKSQKGVSMVEGLIAFGLLGGAGMFLADALSKSSSQEKDLAVRQMLLKTRTTFIQTLRSPDAISNIAKENSYSCLEDMTDCSNRSYTPITVVDGSNVKYTDKSNSAVGITITGVQCTTFPSTSCPFRYVISLKTICIDSDCRVPQFKFLGELSAHKSMIRMPLKTFEFEITAGQAIDSYERSCTSLGGTYQPGTPPSCILSLEGDCPKAPDGTFQGVVGFDQAAKKKICKPIFRSYFNGKTCRKGTPCSATNPTGDAGEVMVGIAPNGDPICKEARLNPGCETLCDSTPACQGYKCQQNPSLPECNPAPPISVLPPTIPTTVGGANGGWGGSGGQFISDGDGGCGGADGC